MSKVKFLNWFKKNWHWIILIAILIFGFYVRVYHIDYPVVGYHNMKEAHTLSEMRNMYDGGNYLINEKDYHKIGEDLEYGVHGDNFPLYSWIVVLLWNIFGINIWVARLVSILFSLGSVIFTYLFIRLLFKKEIFALLSALFVSIMPLLIFFGRQAQYDIVAMFFMTGMIYHFWAWKTKGYLTRYWLLFLTFAILTVISKYTFGIIAIPLLFVFPWKKLKEDLKIKNFKQYCYVVPFAIFFVVWWFFSKSLNEGSRVVSVGIFELDVIKSLYFSSDMWSAIWNYAIIDNFTYIGMILALIAFLIMTFKIKNETYKFFFIWGLSYPLYAAIAPAQMMGHSYYQIPFAPLIAILIAYSITLIANTISCLMKSSFFKKITKLSIILIFLILMYSSLQLSTTRQFDTQFYGLDIAGEFIKENSLEDEWILASSHQDTGVVWHADRKTIDIIPKNLTQFIEFEETYGIDWLFVYQWGIQDYLYNEELSKHISENYSLKQYAFVQYGSSVQPIYLIFQKGGNTNLEDINLLLENKTVQNKNYELTSGEIFLNYINV